ncbi:hypothetical protein ACFFQF_25935 [Haladaptatus pallidirubidus]|uniref:Uncharacterized protein n=1 Tax=Haladaptatus pallidirubidus TaxID=1008152 RepID=A0AAV3UNQ1_9EURY|nr:hypothetical protein [Haladaptatus pallidirubidus]
MPARTEFQSDGREVSDALSRPEIAACNSCPEKVVFLESGNTDGWISSDLTVDLIR